MNLVYKIRFENKLHKVITKDQDSDDEVIHFLEIYQFPNKILIFFHTMSARRVFSTAMKQGDFVY